MTSIFLVFGDKASPHTPRRLMGCSYSGMEFGLFSRTSWAARMSDDLRHGRLLSSISVAIERHAASELSVGRWQLLQPVKARFQQIAGCRPKPPMSQESLLPITAIKNLAATAKSPSATKVRTLVCGWSLAPQCRARQSVRRGAGIMAMATSINRALFLARWCSPPLVWSFQMRMPMP